MTPRALAKLQANGRKAGKRTKQIMMDRVKSGPKSGEPTPWVNKGKV